ncbi:hypothetical protein LOTGIDRAFT_238935 [Lottia gigantea]|uniref:MATH domain-containing protein n=1 Tax=Lottia gigantea TaxID=225164 RepID=V4A565_LOTGI|nr:hypothetical protein LOTGIDRAFT_238935 [Lottia gigantea]ESO99058.1 hypothetical protein LOTGIDRAFT_238935 [Lottia gigantea]
MAAVVNMESSERQDLLKGDNNKGDNHVGIFRFKAEDMTKLGYYYLSDDKYKVNGLHWSCSVKRFQDGQFQVALELLPNDNPLLKSCLLDFRVILLNTNTAINTTLVFESHRKLIVGRKHVGLESVLDWNILTDQKQGFVDANGKFILVLEIQKLREIKSDLKIIFIILMMMVFMLIVMTLLYRLDQTETSTLDNY